MSVEEMWSQFHKLWSKNACGIPYNKQEWKNLEQTILAILSEIKMPVTGPSVDHAYKVGDSITNELVILLKEKYNIERPSILLPLGKKHAAEWDELEARLRETVKEMVWCDHAASF